MKSLILILSLLISSAYSAETLDSLLIKLGSEDFEIREKASDQLATFSPSEISHFLKLSEDYKKIDLEVSDRLFRAAKTMFYKDRYNTDDRILRIRADLDAETCSLFFWSTDLHEKFGAGLQIKTVFKNSANAGQLKEQDIIVKLEGKTYNEIWQDQTFKYGFFKCGCEHNITVIRPRDPDAVADRKAFNESEDAYDLVDIKVKAIDKDLDDNELQTINRILDTEWINFLGK